jgi:hypothetical protein
VNFAFPLTRYILPILLVALSFTVCAQKKTRVIIVDSATFKPLPAVLVQVKNTTRIHMIDTTGIFSIITKPMDTLILSHIGYKEVMIPLFFEEDAILIRMSEKITVLKEVVVRSRKLYPNEISPRISQTKSTAAGSIAVPWDYFSRREKDKRLVNKLMQENDRIRTFVEVVTDPSVKTELMNDYDLSEDVYYETLVKFNKTRSPIIYSNDADAIITALHNFFETNSETIKKP